MFKRHRRWWVALVAAALILGVLTGSGGAPGMMGTAVGFLLWSLILGGFVAGAYRLARRPLDSRQFMSVFTVAFVLIAAFSLMGTYARVSEESVDGHDERPELPPDSRFVRVMLPRGISVEIPKGWWLLGPDYNAMIETATEAALNLADVPVDWSETTNLLAANSLPRETYASIRISVDDPPGASPREIAQLSESDLAAIGQEIMQGSRATLQTTGLEILTGFGTRRTSVDSHPSIVTSYLRSGPNGPVVVHLYLVFHPDFTVRMNLAYREAEEVLWRAVIERLGGSLRIDR